MTRDDREALLGLAGHHRKIAADDRDLAESLGVYDAPMALANAARHELWYQLLVRVAGPRGQD